MSDVRLIVNGRRYQGWKRVRVSSSIESIAGSFDLSISDRWAGQGEAWPIAEEDACKIEIDGVRVLDGYVDRRTLSISSGDRSLSVAGRDKTAALVDNSAVPAKWTFRKAGIYEIAKALCAPFGISVSVKAGLELPVPPAKTVVSPGDSVFEVLERVAKAAGVLLVSDGAAGLLITGQGSRRTVPVVEGENLLGASVEYSGEGRFRRYVCVTQPAGTDNASGAAVRVRAEATDEEVRRGDRVLVIRPDSGITTDFARRRADWEARIRAAKSETVNVQVRGWKQKVGGDLWPVNMLCFVSSPAIGVHGLMLISAREFELSDEGELTSLTLVRPDAFEPEPEEAKVKKAGGRWKELAGGAL